MSKVKGFEKEGDVLYICIYSHTCDGYTQYVRDPFYNSVIFIGQSL